MKSKQKILVLLYEKGIIFRSIHVRSGHRILNNTSILSQSVMTSIVRHIHNIYHTQELNELETCVKNAQIRTSWFGDV